MTIYPTGDRPINTTGGSFYWQQAPVPQGWQCPVCQRVFSPTTAMCLNCPPRAESTATVTFTTGPRHCNLSGCGGTCGICTS